MDRSARTPGTLSWKALLSLWVVALVVFASLVMACGESLTSSSSEATAPPASSQSVEFTTEDELTLSGQLFGTGSAGVILAHMYPTDQSSWYPTAEKLAREGFLVLTFDFRGYGESEGNKEIEHLDRDVSAAVLEIASAGADSVVLVGASMGGTACLKAAAEILASQVSSVRPSPYEIPVAGVATLSAPVEFKGLSAVDAVPKFRIPLLFIAAEDDVGAEGARRLQQLAGGQGDLQICPGSEHGTNLLTGSSAGDVWELLVGFLQRNLAPGETQ